MFTSEQRNQVIQSPLVQDLLKTLVDAATKAGRPVDTEALIDEAIADATRGQNPQVQAVAVHVGHCLIAKTVMYLDTHEAHTKVGELLRKVSSFLFPHHSPAVASTQQ